MIEALSKSGLPLALLLLALASCEEPPRAALTAEAPGDATRVAPSQRSPAEGDATWLLFDDIPAGAQILIDGEPVCVAPCRHPTTTDAVLSVGISIEGVVVHDEYITPRAPSHAVALSVPETSPITGSPVLINGARFDLLDEPGSGRDEARIEFSDAVLELSETRVEFRAVSLALGEAGIGDDEARPVEFARSPAPQPSGFTSVTGAGGERAADRPSGAGVGLVLWVERDGEVTRALLANVGLLYGQRAGQLGFMIQGLKLPTFFTLSRCEVVRCWAEARGLTPEAMATLSDEVFFSPMP